MKLIKNKSFLLFLFIFVFIKQLVWIAVIPIFHTPDEQAHFAQVQNIAEKNVLTQFSSSKEMEISEKLLGVKRDINGNNKFTYHPEYKIEYTNSTNGLDEETINNIPTKERKTLTFVEATGYPPLYYQLSAIGYKLAHDQGIIDRVFFTRIFQLIIYAALILLFYKMSLLFFKPRISIYFLTFIMFLPMPSFVFSGITSDNLMNLLFPAAIYLSLLIIIKGFKIKYFLLFLLIFSIGMKTKPHFIIALPIFFTAVFMKTILTKRIRLLCLFIILSVALFVAANYQSILRSQRTGYVSNFFPDIGSISLSHPLQKTSILNYFSVSLVKTYRETLPWFWGIFRWLSFSLDRWYYRILNLMTIIALISGVVYFLKNIRRKKGIFFWQIIFLAVSVLIYALVLFFWDYLFFLSHGFSFGIQGRYYFPVLFPIIFLFFYFTHKFFSMKLLAMFSVVLNMYALFKLSVSYYDISSVGNFITQASQYKPWFFKGVGFVIPLLTYLMFLLFFLIQLIRDKKHA